MYCVRVSVCVLAAADTSEAARSVGLKSLGLAAVLSHFSGGVKQTS